MKGLVVAHAMTGVGIIVVILAAFPLGYSEWLPRWAQFLAGVWIAVVGIGLTLMLTAEDEE